MPAEYCQHGIRFLYPENWQLTEADDEDGNPGLSLESPDGGLLLLQFYPTTVASARLLKEMERGLRQQYEDLEGNDCERMLASQVATGREALFYCLDFLVQARCLVFDTPNHRVAAVYQAETRLFGRLEMVFDAILTGLVQSSLPGVAPAP